MFNNSSGAEGGGLKWRRGRVKGFAEMARKKGKAKSRTFVLDCSVTLAWFFEDGADAYSEAVEDALASASAVVPSFLKSMPITTDEEAAARAWQETLQLARAQNLSVYDATYLELAMRQALPLATLDENLKAAAAAVGVAEYKP
jgi:predicted nucleic acid-binding protein